MKKVKFILPVVAIMFAVAGVFATGNSKPALVVVNATLGYLAPEENCTKDGTCNNATVTTTCVTASGTVLKKINGESCEEDAIGAFTYAP